MMFSSFLFFFPLLCFLVAVGAEAQRTEQHAGALQAEAAHSTLRGRWRPLFVVQYPYTRAGVVSHP